MSNLAVSLDELAVNVVRGLAIDAVQKANSGHPGLPMGAAPMAHVLWTRFLRHNPKNPRWFDRDRFILSAGHGSMLLYALLFLTGYDLTLDDIKQFRQWESRTPGHPENFMTPGVEMATGPLGQGFATAVGIAVAERFLAANYNKPEYALIDHWTYVIASDGDLMEGVAQEAASFAGHQSLGKLIVLYDDNGITIDGTTELSFTEDTPKKFEALGWHVQKCDGMDMAAVESCLHAARQDPRPSIICAKTTIGYGSPHKAGTSGVHGSPLGPDEVKATKANLGLPETDFYLPDDAVNLYRQAVEKGAQAEGDWNEKFARYAQDYPKEAAELRAVIDGAPIGQWPPESLEFTGSKATRNLSGDVLQQFAPHWPGLITGNADLTENVFTAVKSGGVAQADTPAGRNLAFGVREHALAACLNGITIHGGTHGLGGTFLIFSDYCRPSIRLAALMHCPTTFVFSHDSIGLGEDGPTHQPIEHIASLRAIPNVDVFRPADGHETAVGWALALEAKENPTVLVLTRQAVPTITPPFEPDHPAFRGAYVLRDDDGMPDITLVGTGSEVQLCLAAADTLAQDGVKVRVVSMPSWFQFERQEPGYRRTVLNPAIPTVSVEAGTSFGWARYADAHVSIDQFGSSAPGPVLMEKFGFTAEHVVEVARSLLRD